MLAVSWGHDVMCHDVTCHGITCHDVTCQDFTCHGSHVMMSYVMMSVMSQDVMCHDVMCHDGKFHDVMMSWCQQCPLTCPQCSRISWGSLFSRHRALSGSGNDLERYFPILDTRISFVRPSPPPSSVTLVLPPLKSETGWTGELWLNCVLLILEN